MNRIENLRAVLYERPELPVICMVSEAVVPSRSIFNSDDETAPVGLPRWRGAVGKAHIEKVWIGEDAAYYYDPDEVDPAAINDPACVYPEMELTEERAREVYDALPWKEVIVIDIEEAEE